MRGKAPATDKPSQAMGERLAEMRMASQAVECAVYLLGAKPFPGSEDAVTGECGHPMPGREWIDGWRVCAACPQEGLFDYNPTRET